MRAKIFQDLMMLIVLGIISAGTVWGGEEIPHLKKQGTATQLIVDGKPYLVRALRPPMDEIGIQRVTIYKYQ